MAYSTVEEVKKILVGRRLEDRNETPNELDNDQIEYAINSADAEIDGALRRIYTVPFVGTIPSLVHYLSIDIACYLCDLLFRGQQGANAESPSVLRYERVRRMLNELKSGRIELDAIEKLNVSDLESVFNDYWEPLFPFAHIFKGGSEYAEGVFPDDRSHY